MLAPGSASATAASGAVTNAASGTCLTVQGAVFANLTPVQLSSCDGSAGQSWVVNSNKTITSGGYCLDAYNPGSGYVTQLYSCTGSVSQTWAVSGGHIVSSVNSLCLNNQSQSTANSAPIDFAPCDTRVSENWVPPSTALTYGSLIFSDDFNGAKGALPDPKKWADYSACTYNGSAAFGGIQCGNNETLDGLGDLVIPATPTTGSAIRTTNSYAFEYGVFSAWIKIPTQVGYWPAFWTLNNGYDGTNHPLLGEADAMESYTTWPTLYHATGHNWTNDGTPGSGGDDNLCGGPQKLSSAFHKYSVKIAPNEVTFYFDNVRCGAAFTPQTNPGKPYGFGPSVTSRNWMIFDLAVGGAGGQQQPATQAARLLVSRVEVRGLPSP